MVDEAELLSRATTQARDLAYRSGVLSGLMADARCRVRAGRRKEGQME
jgi:hypothetical protein